RSSVAVFLSTFETQGIALAEAWSMDVPTLVWNPRSSAEWRGRRFVAGSSCPYLTPATGLDWVTLGDLQRVLIEAIDGRTGFQPRRWTLEHMTDAVCSQTLYDLIMNGARSLAAAG